MLIVILTIPELLPDAHLPTVHMQSEAFRILNRDSRNVPDLVDMIQDFSGPQACQFTIISVPSYPW